MQCAKIVTRHFFVYLSLPAIIYFCEVSNGNTRTMREMCSELTIKASERGQWHVCGNWPCQASKMKLLIKIINSLQPLTIFTKISILQVWSGQCVFWSVFSRIWTEWGKMQDKIWTTIAKFYLSYSFIGIILSRCSQKYHNN